MRGSQKCMKKFVGLHDDCKNLTKMDAREN